MLVFHLVKFRYNKAYRSEDKDVSIDHVTDTTETLSPPK